MSIDINSSDTDKSQTNIKNLLNPITKPKRHRRKFEDIDRYFICNYQNCGKSYGSLAHLNEHRIIQKHGPRMKIDDFNNVKNLIEYKKLQQRIKNNETIILDPPSDNQYYNQLNQQLLIAYQPIYATPVRNEYLAPIGYPIPVEYPLSQPIEYPIPYPAYTAAHNHNDYHRNDQHVEYQQVQPYNPPFNYLNLPNSNNRNHNNNYNELNSFNGSVNSINSNISNTSNISNNVKLPSIKSLFNNEYEYDNDNDNEIYKFK